MRASDVDDLRERRFAYGVGSAGSGLLVGLGGLLVAVTPAVGPLPASVVGPMVSVTVGCLAVGGHLVGTSY
jgi:hypothetical protein